MLISSISVPKGLVIDACPKQEDITTIRFFFLGHRRLDSSYFIHQLNFSFLFFSFLHSFFSWKVLFYTARLPYVKAVSLAEGRCRILCLESYTFVIIDNLLALQRRNGRRHSNS